MLTHKQIPAAEKPPRWSTTGGGAGGGFLKSRLPIDQMIQIRFSRLGRVRGADKAGGSVGMAISPTGSGTRRVPDPTGAGAGVFFHPRV
jgi:hypothetical protein